MMWSLASHDQKNLLSGRLCDRALSLTPIHDSFLRLVADSLFQVGVANDT